MTQFLELTERQVDLLLKKIRRRKLVTEYREYERQAALKGITVKPLDEIIGQSNEPVKDEKAFDDSTDKALDIAALKKFAQRKK